MSVLILYECVTLIHVIIFSIHTCIRVIYCIRTQVNIPIYLFLNGISYAINFF